MPNSVGGFTAGPISGNTEGSDRVWMDVKGRDPSVRWEQCCPFSVGTQRSVGFTRAVEADTLTRHSSSGPVGTLRCSGQRKMTCTSWW
jgi:hypothetical protein